MEVHMFYNNFIFLTEVAKVTEASKNASPFKPAYLPVSVIQSVPSTRPIVDAPVKCRESRASTIYNNVEHPGNANPVSPTPGSTYRTYEEVVKCSPATRVEPRSVGNVSQYSTSNTSPRAFGNLFRSTAHGEKFLAPNSHPETSRISSVAPFQLVSNSQPLSPDQATYKFIHSPPTPYPNSHSPPQTAYTQSSTFENSFPSFSPTNIIQSSSLYQSMLTREHLPAKIGRSDVNNNVQKTTVRSRSPSPVYRHKKHCAPGKIQRSRPFVVSSQNLTSPQPSRINDSRTNEKDLVVPTLKSPQRVTEQHAITHYGPASYPMSPSSNYSQKEQEKLKPVVHSFSGTPQEPHSTAPLSPTSESEEPNVKVLHSRLEFIQKKVGCPQLLFRSLHSILHQILMKLSCLIFPVGAT